MNDYVVYRVNLDGTGKNIMNIYNQTPPVSPDRLKQYLVAKVVLQKITRGKKRTAVNLACTLKLLEWLSSKDNSSFDQMREKLNLQSDILALGNAEAEIYIHQIKEELLNVEYALQTKKIKLTDDYLRGFHCGDGSLMIVYQVNNNRLRFIPTWTLTNNSKALLCACQNTLKVGNVKRLNLDKPYYQFVVNSVTDFENQVIGLFKNYQIPSNYKQKQWEKVYKAYQILKNKEHLISQQSWNDFIDFTYDISETNKRKYSKDFYYQMWVKTNCK